MKYVQIPEDLFVKIVKYHLDGKTGYAEEIKEGLDKKLEALLKRQLYSEYKQGDEESRKLYLDLVGITEDFRWQSTYEFLQQVKRDDCMCGCVKTDHPSKLSYQGDVQQLSYQMINTLPCSYEEIGELAKTSIEYVELLKRDNDAFEEYLMKNASVP